MENKKTEVLEVNEKEEANENGTEVRILFNIKEEYKWASSHDEIGEMITLSNDIGELSIYSAGETIFKSHIYSALDMHCMKGRT